MCLPHNTILNNIEKDLIDPNNEIENCEYTGNSPLLDCNCAKSISKTINNNECNEWCSDNKNCKIIETSIDDKGNTKCNYYKDDKKLIYYKNNLNKILYKRDDKYIYNPIKKDKKISNDFNQFPQGINEKSGTSYINYIPNIETFTTHPPIKKKISLFKKYTLKKKLIIILMIVIILYIISLIMYYRR